MPTTTLDLQTLFTACRNLEKYYGGAAELVGGLAWQPGVSPATEIPEISSEVAEAVAAIANDVSSFRPCPIFPHCVTIPGDLVTRIAQVDSAMESVTVALERLVPYFTARPDVTNLTNSGPR